MNKWHKRHEFIRGWVWYRESDKFKLYVSDLFKRGIKYEDFLSVDASLIEQIVEDVKKERQIRKEQSSKDPIEIKFDKVTMPKFKKEMPTEPLDSKPFF